MRKTFVKTEIVKQQFINNLMSLPTIVTLRFYIQGGCHSLTLCLGESLSVIGRVNTQELE